MARTANRASYDPIKLALLVGTAKVLGGAIMRHVKRRKEKAEAEARSGITSKKSVTKSLLGIPQNKSNSEFDRFVQNDIKDRNTPPPIPKGKKLAAIYAAHGINPKKDKEWPRKKELTTTDDTLIKKMSPEEHLLSVLELTKKKHKENKTYLEKRRPGISSYYPDYLKIAKSAGVSPVPEHHFNRIMYKAGYQYADLTPEQKAAREKTELKRGNMYRKWKDHVDSVSGFSAAHEKSFPPKVWDDTKPYGGVIGRYDPLPGTETALELAKTKAEKMWKLKKDGGARPEKFLLKNKNKPIGEW